VNNTSGFGGLLNCNKFEFRGVVNKKITEIRHDTELLLVILKSCLSSIVKNGCLVLVLLMIRSVCIVPSLIFFILITKCLHCS